MASAFSHAVTALGSAHVSIDPVFQREFPIWSSDLRIVRFSCHGHNEIAT